MLCVLRVVAYRHTLVVVYQLELKTSLLMTLIPAESDDDRLSCYNDILPITDIGCSSYLTDAIFCIHVRVLYILICY